MGQGLDKAAAVLSDLPVNEARAWLDGIALDRAATEARACLDHLLGLEVEGRLLADWLAAPDAEAQRARLRQGGILPDPPGWAGHFAVARHSRPLARHFAATEWARGGWGDALAHLPGARRGAAPLRVHPGENTRVVLIPYRLVREADHD